MDDAFIGLGNSRHRSPHDPFDGAGALLRRANRHPEGVDGASTFTHVNTSSPEPCWYRPMDDSLRQLEATARRQAALTTDARTKAALVEIAEEYRARAEYTEREPRPQLWGVD